MSKAKLIFVIGCGAVVTAAAITGCSSSSATTVVVTKTPHRRGHADAFAHAEADAFAHRRPAAAHPYGTAAVFGHVVTSTHFPCDLLKLIYDTVMTRDPNEVSLTLAEVAEW